MVSDIFVADDHNRNGQIEWARPPGGNVLKRLGNWLFWHDGALC